jgi:hypothetical protein
MAKPSNYRVAEEMLASKCIQDYRETTLMVQTFPKDFFKILQSTEVKHLVPGIT